MATNGTVSFVRKRLKDGTTLPLSERERIAFEKAVHTQTRINARHNMAGWMRDGMEDWSEEQFTELLMMLGLDDIDVENTVPGRVAIREPEPEHEGPGEVDA